MRIVIAVALEDRIDMVGATTIEDISAWVMGDHTGMDHVGVLDAGDTRITAMAFNQDSAFQLGFSREKEIFSRFHLRFCGCNNQRSGNHGTYKT